MPQPLAFCRVVSTMVIDNNDSRTFKPVALMIGGKAEINASGSFRISNQYGLRSEIINSPPAANNSLKRNSLLLIKLIWTEWSL